MRKNFNVWIPSEYETSAISSTNITEKHRAFALHIIINIPIYFISLMWKYILSNDKHILIFETLKYSDTRETFKAKANIVYLKFQGIFIKESSITCKIRFWTLKIKILLSVSFTTVLRTWWIFAFSVQTSFSRYSMK